MLRSLPHSHLSSALPAEHLNSVLVSQRINERKEEVRKNAWEMQRASLVPAAESPCEVITLVSTSEHAGREKIPPTLYSFSREMLSSA